MFSSSKHIGIGLIDAGWLSDKKNALLHSPKLVGLFGLSFIIIHDREAHH
jgi:hypothetical protein